MDTHVSRSVGRILALVFAAILPVALSAQVTAAPSGKTASGDPPSKWDIFAGYSYLAPKATVGPDTFNAINMGAILSISRYFNKNVGVTLEGDEHLLRPENGVVTGTQPQNDFSGGSGGIIGRFPSDNITAFVHALVGAEQAGAYGLGYNDVWGPVITVGGGLDYETPLLQHHLAIRIFQADYQWTRESFPSSGAGIGVNGPSYPATSVNMARLSAGLVFHIGSLAPPVPVTLACSANPESVFPGDPVTVTATAGGLDPKLSAVYSFTGAGVTSSGATATVATASLAPGTYTVQCMVKEGKPGKEGLKPGQSASSSASFTVKAFEPPTISCSASPSTIQPGQTSTITATGMSPQNRPLTYTYTASSGTINGTGTTASFDSTGAAPGTVNVNCNVADDKGNRATANAMITIVAPPPPPEPSPEQLRLEARLSLHSVFFATAQPTAQHPEGGLVESQQQTLTTLATDFKNYLAIKPDAHLTLTGHADVRGSVAYNQALTERRVNRVKQFLLAQGVPEGSIDTRAEGKEQELSADQVKALVNENTELTDAQRQKVLRQLKVIVLAQNRRVDITLSTTGQKSEQLYPFNAVDASTLLSATAPAPSKKAMEKKAK